MDARGDDLVNDGPPSGVPGRQADRRGAVRHVETGHLVTGDATRDPCGELDVIAEFAPLHIGVAELVNDRQKMTRGVGPRHDESAWRTG